MREDNNKKYGTRDKESRTHYTYNKDGVLKRNMKEEEYQKFLLDTTEALVKDQLAFISKTQMRNIFDLIRNCNEVNELKMIKPKLLYTAGRLTKKYDKQFLVDLSTTVADVESKEELQCVKKYIETVLAYHKYYAKN